MRITAGEHKGKTIIVPSSDTLRPSQDQVRLAIFNMLESSYLEGFYYDELSVVDLYAGTGALGIEALSRGVQHVDFVEHERRHAKAIIKTLEQNNMKTMGKVYTQDVKQFLAHTSKEIYDIVFLDPPYDLFEQINVREIVPLLKPHGVLIYLHGERNKPVKTVQNENTWKLKETREYGATGVSFYTQSI